MRGLVVHWRRFARGLIAPLGLRFAGGYPCCCEEPGSETSTIEPPGSGSTIPKPAPEFDEDCGGNCAGSPETNLPATWQVTIHGLTSGINCDCDPLVGTYFCDWVGPVGAAPCVWRGPVPGQPCGYLTCEVQIFQAVNRFIRAILVGNLSTGIPPGAFFDATQSAPFNCGIERTINGNLGSSTFCATTGHTCTITPV